MDEDQVAESARTVLDELAGNKEAAWVQCPENRMKVYEYLDAAYLDEECIVHFTALVVRTIMAAAPALVADELPVALAVLGDGWESGPDVQAHVHDLWAASGVPTPWPALADLTGLNNVLLAWWDHEALDAGGVAAVRDLVQPKLPLLWYSTHARESLCELLLRGFRPPYAIATDFARAMYAMDSALFCKEFGQAVCRMMDGQEDIDEAKDFWTACAFPGTFSTSCFSKI